MRPSLSILSFMDCAFGVLAKKQFPSQGHLDFFLCYLVEILWFYVLHLDLWSILSQNLKGEKSM
jgi:hypothetical protein